MGNTNLFKKFLSFSYGSIIGLGIGFFTTLVTTRILTPEDFGKASMFSLALGVIMIFVILGTDQSFIRFFYEEQEEKRGALLYNSIKLPIILAILIGAVILIFHEKLSLFLFGEQNLNIIILLVVGILTQLVFRYALLVIRMQQKGNLFSVIEITNRTLQLLLLVFAYLIIGQDYKIVVYSTVITFIILVVLTILLGNQFWSPKNLFVKNLKHSKIEIVKYGFPLGFTVLITWLFQSFDKIALRQWSTFEELGLYTAAFKIVALLTVVQASFSTFWTSVCYEKFEESPEDRDFFARISKLVSLGMFIIAIITIMFKDLIIMVLGTNYAGASSILPFLVFIPLMYTISETTVIGINFYKKTKWHILIAGLSCVINIFGNWILVPTLGGLGAAISTAFSYILFFTLRTQISLMYYKVKYELGKIYLMCVVLVAYAFMSIWIDSLLINVILGVLSLMINLIVYRKELFVVLKSVKSR